ncbi:protein-tyrosine-phosphatase IBR5 isoform X3 [Brachypodium distachyon]|uniref:protein-tyrosine-phosphatase IBR5 isoform X3 n=1 Tax=Brachypodium distachyon TaxID=15368 RepID=UPI000D0DE7CD|nr:protein-tyrosine-phosphatase IBR5 isoform X3 [Brachypodium distachyon]|eukprot:XP_024316492.1 protein-tyrosine-phosphatase IBR5 isoform X3 [Brachypodium distachyon]
MTMPDCHNLYRNLFAYHCLQDDKTLDFDGATQFLQQCVREKSRVLVHCMSGKNRSAAVVTAFLMKSRGWRVAQCFQWVKDRRPQVLLTEASQGLLVEYEQKLFGPNASILAQTVVLTESFPSLGFGFPEPSGDIQVPAFSQSHVPSIFERAGPNNVPSNFSFGEGIMEVNPSNSGTVTSTSCDNQMDSS